MEWWEPGEVGGSTEDGWLRRAGCVCWHLCVVCGLCALDV
jgi:hypothetical protein